MVSSTALASIFGPLLIITGCWTLLYKNTMKKIFKSLKETPALVYFLGILNLLIGMVFVTRLNCGYMGIEILVTILGWLFLIRGFLLMFFPKILDKMIQGCQRFYILVALIGIVWGVVLTWFAFS